LNAVPHYRTTAELDLAANLFLGREVLRGGLHVSAIDAGIGCIAVPQVGVA
jgi:hypothetical protein